jgi:hypothetical protein
MLCLLPLGLGYTRNVNRRCMYTMAFTMCNKPIRLIVLAAQFQRDLMGYVPFLPNLNLALAHMAYATMTQEDRHARLGADPDALHGKRSLI